MRYATVVIIPEGGGFHPADRALAQDPAVERDAIHQVNLLADDTAVVLYEIRGDMDRARRVIREVPSVISCDVAGDREGLAYVHFEPDDTTHALLAIVQETEIVLDTPIECLDNGGIRVTIIGEEEPIRRAVDSVPDHLVLSLEGLGDYTPDSGHLFSALTDRQQEVLEAAVELGYYEVPRRATHDDIASSVGLSAGTVGEHLRKVEEKILRSVVPR